MATKTGILATINGFITAIITQAKHRSSMATVVDEIYPITITDSSDVEEQTYTTKSGTNITYSITIKKSGNIAHLKGTITNVSGLYLSTQPIFTWNESEFTPAVMDVYFFAENSTDKVRLKLNADGLSIFNSSMINATYNFDFKTYLTQD